MSKQKFEKLALLESLEGFDVNEYDGEGTKCGQRPPEFSGELGLAVDQGDEPAEGNPDEELGEDPAAGEAVAHLADEGKSGDEEEEEADAAGDGSELLDACMIAAGEGAGEEGTVAHEDEKDTDDVKDMVECSWHSLCLWLAVGKKQARRAGAAPGCNRKSAMNSLRLPWGVRRVFRPSGCLYASLAGGGSDGGAYGRAFAP